MEYFNNDGNIVEFSECDYVRIHLKHLKKNANEEQKFMLISNISLKCAQQFEWYYGNDGYPIAYTNIITKRRYGRKGIKMHRLLLGNECNEEEVIDHINRDKLDNRLENLRICSKKQNSYNTSRKEGKYKGVRKNKNGTFTASITKDGIKNEIKHITTEKEAALIYDMMAAELFGIYAGTNFQQ